MSYLRYFFRAKTKYEVHSPFVYEFIREVLEDDREYYAFRDIQRQYENLLLDDRTITVTDFGAGSKIHKGNVRSVKSIARTAVSPISKGKLLYRMINHYKPANLVELGTSLGISSLFMALTSTKNKLITIEGCPETANIAQNLFSKFRNNRIELLTGKFEDQLPVALNRSGKVDFVFFDGNHRKGPTIDYFHSCLEAIHSKSIFVFDDIHWSEEMESAWDEIKQHPKVRLSIDLYRIGIIFFRPEIKEVQHYTLIESRKKPWRMGFFSSSVES